MSRIFTTHYLDQNDEDLTCVVTYTAINNISLDITLSGFTAPNEVGYWKAVIEDLTLKIMERFEQNQDELIRFSVTGEGEFTSHAGDTTPASLRSRPRTLSFDGRTRSGQILLGFDEVFEPEHQEATGSGLRVLTLLETLNVKLVFPEHFNPQRLAVHHQFYAGCPLVKFAHIPFNKDKYCVLHSIYSTLTFAKPHLPKTNLNADPEYMTGFTDWFLANQLERFYHENLFLKILREGGVFCIHAGCFLTYLSHTWTCLVSAWNLTQNPTTISLASSRNRSRFPHIFHTNLGLSTQMRGLRPNEPAVYRKPPLLSIFLH